MTPVWEQERDVLEEAVRSVAKQARNAYGSSMPWRPWAWLVPERGHVNEIDLRTVVFVAGAPNPSPNVVRGSRLEVGVGREL
jgi:hypothetical protein